ncbi:MAG: LptF/LptG family permease, partial [Planctomycetota bacterium]
SVEAQNIYIRGRLRADGGLTTLRAAGLPPWRVLISPWPLLLVTAILVGLLNHLVLPTAMRQLMTVKQELLQQGLSAKVARKQALFHEDGRLLVAGGMQGRQLQDVVAVETGPERTSIAYAPQADWVIADERLALQTGELRALAIDTDLRAPAHLDPGSATGEADNRGAGTDASQGGSQPPGVVALRADDVVQHLDLDDQTAEAIDKPRAMDWQQLQAMGPALHAAWAAAKADNRHHGGLNKRYRKWQLQRHQRFYEAAAVVAQAALALALALRLPAHNQALSLLLALILVGGIGMPGQLVVSGSARSLDWHPAYAMWPVASLTLLLGAWLIRRWR